MASLFPHLLHPRISFSVLLIVLAIAIAATCAVLAFANIRKFRNVILVWLIACLYLMFHIAIFGRESREFYSLHLIPFWSIESIQNGFVETLYEKLNNILFFIPFGCLLGMWFSLGTRSTSRSNNSNVSLQVKRPLLLMPISKVLIHSLIAGITTSIVIELLQLITKTGTCETDDVICNTVGCAIGSLVVAGMVRIISRKHT